MEMAIDLVRTGEFSGGRRAEEEDLPFIFRRKVKIPEKIESLLAEELKDLEEALSLAARTKRENRKVIEIVKGMGPLEEEEAFSIGHRRKVKPEKGTAVQEWQPEAELEKALSLAVRSGLLAEEVRKFLRVAVLSNLMDYDVHSLAVKSGLKDEDAVSLANNFRTMYRIIFRALHAQLLGSFDRRRFDPELCQWKRFGRFVKDWKKKEVTPFLLFKIKASAKNGKVTWWRKEYAHFPPERQGYTGVLRVARLVVGRDGSSRLEEAGEDGQPGAISTGRDRYRSSDRRVGVLKDGWLSPLDEVAIVRRLPGSDGISIMSCVDGLGVKLGEFLFVLHVAWTVALSFTERPFYVPSKFTEETLYAIPGVDFIDITIPIENLIKKLYQMYEQEKQEKQEEQDRKMYEQEEQDRKMMLDQQDPQETQEMMCQQEESAPRLEEEERKKEESRLVKKETKKHNEQRDFEEDCVRCLEESDWLQPLDDEMWQSGERPVEENDLLKLGRGGIRGTEEPLPA